jgi:alkanesulfonate monooxygenase SsuD/methylene tetrahydromethanopterin reductase-like flavin-dependent oxidoreductase (luciferase family)
MHFGFFSVQDYYPGLSPDQQRFFAELLDRIAYAEDLGFDSFWLAEHHFHLNYGLDPWPPIVLAAAAQHTRQIRLGSAVAVLPFHHPLRVAEDYALLDILSGGRLNFGVGSGYLAHEYAGWGIPQAEARARHDEALAIILRAWQGERFRYAGTFTTVEDVTLQVQPVQKPHPPVWIAFLHAESAYQRGRQGYQIMGVPYATVPQLSQLRELIARWREGYREAGKDPDQGRVVMALHTYVAESDAQAETEARACLERYLATRLFGKGSWESLTANQLAAIGSPDTVAATVETLQATGATDLLCLMDFGGLDHQLVRRSMALFAREVVPRFQPAPVITG